MNNTYYDILGVKQTVSEEELKGAYRKLMSIYHPDKNNGDTHAVKLSQIINEAYDTLKDPERRKRYDSQLVNAKVAATNNESPISNSNNSPIRDKVKKGSGLGSGFWLVIYLAGGMLLSSQFGSASPILMLFCVVVLVLILIARAKENK